jgi:hypothetical protein
MRKGSGTGIHLDEDGYYVIHRRGFYRNRYAHRAYVDWQLMECGQRTLRADEHVEHLCKNRQCWPPTDGHLLIMPVEMKNAIDPGHASRVRLHQLRKSKGKKNARRIGS